MIIKAVKKPVAIKAVQWTGNNFEEIKKFCGKFEPYNAEIGISSDDVAYLKRDMVQVPTGITSTTCTYKVQPQFTLMIRTLEGDHKANVGDYIIKGVRGECYPIKSSIFEETYDIV